MAILAVGGGLALATAVSAQAAAGLTLSPGGPYTSGQTVTVSGTGFIANQGLRLVHCDPAVPKGGACDMGAYKQVTTDANGAFSTSITLNAKFGSTDCTAVQCAVLTSSVENPRDTSQEGRVNTTFAKAGASTPAASTPAASKPGASKPASGTNKTYPKAASTGGVESSRAPSAALFGAGLVLGAGALLVVRRGKQASHR